MWTVVKETIGTPESPLDDGLYHVAKTVLAPDGMKIVRGGFRFRPADGSNYLGTVVGIREMGHMEGLYDNASRWLVNVSVDRPGELDVYGVCVSEAVFGERI